MTESQERRLCEPRLRDGTWYRCGLVVLERDLASPEACPSNGGGRMFVCHDCMNPVSEFLRRVCDARAVRMEHQVQEEEWDFEPLP
jgi:hypothetical protein